MNLTKKNFIIIVIGLILITFISFFPSLHNGFVSWDDEGYLHENKYIMEFSAQSIAAIFSNIIMANYHPLTITVYAAIYKFFQLDPFPYHLFNVVFHVINVLLLFYFVQKFTQKLTIAIVVSSLFALHPLHVESVTWISETKDVLYTFFFLLAMIYYWKFMESAKKIKKYYIISLLLFVLSCLSKAMAVVLPLILMLMDYFTDNPLQQKSATQKNVSKKNKPAKQPQQAKPFHLIHSAIEKIPFFIVAFIFGIIAIYAQQADKGIADTSDLNLLDRIVLPFYGVLFYIIKMILPINLSIIYPYPIKINGVLPIEALIAPIVILLIAWGVFYSRKKTKYLIFGSLFFLAAILPVLQIIPVGISIASDRYFYLSSIGLFFIVGYGFEKLTTQNTMKNVAWIGFSIIIIIFAILTHQRTKVWNNSISLWQSVMDYNPSIDKAYYGIGNEYYRQNNLEKAIPYFKKTIEVNPKNIKALNNLSNCYYHKKQYDSAEFLLNRLLIIDPNYPNAYHNLGNIYYTHGKIDTAMVIYKKAIAIDKNFAISYYTIGLCHLAKNNKEEALKYIKIAADLGQADAINYLKNSNIKQ